MPSHAWLVAQEGPLAGRRFPLGAPCLVGRGPYNHVVLDDTRISRQHAKISPEAGGHVVYDLNSANGTFVNERPVKRQGLAAGDRVRFGPFDFTFEIEQLQDHTAPIPVGKKFVEVLTTVGTEGPAKIVDTLDARSDTNPGSMPQGIGLAELEDADRKLRTLYTFLQSVSSTLDVAELLERVLGNLLDVFPDADVATIYLRSAETGELEPRKSRRREEGTSAPATMPAQIYQELVDKGRAVLSAPAVTGKRAPTGGLAMHAPLIFDGVTQGVIHVRGPEGGGHPFHQPDLDLLTGLAAQAALALANARMHQEQLKQERLRQDLLLAEQIQRSFLPRQLPQVDGIEFITEYRPAFSVGGDFYDVFWLAYDRIGLFIGDVSGKGVSAALLMARISSDLRLAALAEPDPARVIAHVNRILLERRQPDIFVTGVYATLDVGTHQLTIANAGHLPPLVRRSREGVLERIEGSGTAIGIFEDAEYAAVPVTLSPGDAILFCTDGVPEAVNLSGAQFGFERVEASAATGPSRAVELAARLLYDVRAHVGEAQQSDDLTLLVCGITETERRKRRDEPTDAFPIISG